MPVVSYSISTSNHNLFGRHLTIPPVVSYSISTSNHNIPRLIIDRIMLYLIPFLHQTTTRIVSCFCTLSCILFHFYIKPQQKRSLMVPDAVVSYSISTSNHNWVGYNQLRLRLYLIPFLHQTTTVCLVFVDKPTLYLIPFLHQTTTTLI